MNQPVTGGTPRERVELAKTIVRSGFGCSEPSDLGYGSESVILTDGAFVYKVFDNNPEYYCSHLSQLKGRFSGCRRLIDDLDCKTVDGHAVLFYRYEDSDPYVGGREEEIEEFLVEAASAGIVINDVKPLNFRVFSNGLKFIDYGQDVVPFDNKNFLFMAQRAFLSVHQWGNPDFKALARKAISRWDLPELNGFITFFNNVYAKLTEVSATGYSYPLLHMPDNRWFDEARSGTHLFADVTCETYRDCGCPECVTFSNCQIPNDSTLIVDDVDEKLASRLRSGLDVGQKLEIFCKNPFFSDEHGSLRPIAAVLERAGLYLCDTEMSPPKPDEKADFYSEVVCLRCTASVPQGKNISLLIKTCYQDGEMIGTLVKHLVTQLEGPDFFAEKIVVVDSKENDFLREYSKNKKAETIQTLESLVRDRLIDRFIVCPTDRAQITEINRRWFGLDCAETHCVRNIPVTPQLFGFESCRSDYILQADCDALIVRRDRSHSYLSDMKKVLDENPNALSVSFNIAHPNTGAYAEYKSETDGKPYVPEVRICLLNRKRFFGARPYPNQIIDNRLALTWYRSAELLERQKGFSSLRGGDPRTFYVHPPNSIKTDMKFWKAVLKTAESGHVPDIQNEQVDLMGAASDWAVPKITANYVFIIAGRNLSNRKFLRCWQSVTRQTMEGWGAVIVDDSSDNNVREFIREAIKPYPKTVAFVDNTERKGILENIYCAIHDYCLNPYSVIVILDMDDTLLSNDTLYALDEQYLKGSDMVVGTALKAGQRILPFVPDFNHPRNEHLGDVWIHLRSFRKYLFDAISEDDFKKDGRWISKFTELTYTVPIAEMARCPTHIHWPVYYWEPGHVRDEEHYRLNKIAVGYMRGKPTYVSTEPVRAYAGYSMPPGELLYTIHDGTVTFIRHAEKEKKNCFFLSCRTTERGNESARRWGSSVPLKIGLFLSSTIERAIDTAWCIREGNRSSAPIVPLRAFNGICIRDRNRWEQMKSEHTYQDLIRLWEKDEIPASVIEPYKITTSRLLKTVWKEITDRRAGTAIVVTHDHVIWLLLELFKGLSKHRVPYLGGLTVTKEEVYRKIIELDCAGKKHEMFHTSDDTIEIDITYRCDLKCLNCDRSCRQAPADDDMSVEQIESFISESETEARDWKRIRIMGGEPLLHPDIPRILELFAAYADRHPTVCIELFTNGLGKDLSQVPKQIGVHNTMKKSPVNVFFEPYNLAPQDLMETTDDHLDGCWITADCGIGLNRYGYYMCAAGAAVDRVFGFDIGLRKIPERGDDMLEARKYLCQYCGHGLGCAYQERDSRVPLDIEAISESWTRAYSEYRQRKPQLTAGGRR